MDIKFYVLDENRRTRHNAGPQRFGEEEGGEGVGLAKQILLDIKRK